jgi:hypothetical protein
MLKSILSVAFGVLAFFSLPVSAQENCSAYEAEAEAFSGVVPKFDESGKLRALLMYGEGSFVTPKRSLIANARRKAEMRARQAYAEFLNSEFDSQTLSKNLVQTAESTKEDGETVGSATELSSTLEQMRNNASATMSGLVKLDECVDTAGKYVLVTLGWKPSLSRAAANSQRQMTQPAASAETAKSPGQTGAAAQSSAPSDSGKSSGSEAAPSGKLAGVELITVETRGIGVSLRSATNEALKSAVSQVFGEQFAAQTSVIDSVDSVSASAGGIEVGAVVEQSSSKSAVQSSTSGLISSWSYIEQTVVSGEHRVKLTVTVPQYQSSIDPSKSTIIVVPPQPAPGVDVADGVFTEFSNLLRAELEASMNATSNLTVLDRGFTRLAESELAGIQASGNVSEMAKLGGKVGADLMLVPVIDEFKYEMDSRKIGEQVIERMVFNVTITTKVIEVATTNLIDTRRFPQRNKKIRSDTPTQEMALFMANRLGRHLIKKVGGSSASSSAATYEPEPDVDALRKGVDKQFEGMKKNVQDDW